jgi:hypothetical protein
MTISAIRDQSHVSLSFVASACRRIHARCRSDFAMESPRPHGPRNHAAGNGPVVAPDSWRGTET